ncbi:hypothetical protein CMESO_100 (nucleomorph) [Chroomonas mesostigmatica CCMP1168]|uniref:Uncharacterized protein n=1 Tax=Chroomonas mesostigmatica CCMP1168 TaxID=1195612 RepID=J7G2P6_9CRYP|nr:hypothetical protein CMESO_100 [Chroomonas mesostigmatica CCMP1168]
MLFGDLRAFFGFENFIKAYQLKEKIEKRKGCFDYFINLNSFLSEEENNFSLILFSNNIIRKKIEKRFANLIKIFLKIKIFPQFEKILKKKKIFEICLFFHFLMPLIFSSILWCQTIKKYIFNGYFSSRMMWFYFSRFILFFENLFFLFTHSLGFVIKKKNLSINDFKKFLKKIKFEKQKKFIFFIFEKIFDFLFQKKIFPSHKLFFFFKIYQKKEFFLSQRNFFFYFNVKISLPILKRIKISIIKNIFFEITTKLFKTKIKLKKKKKVLNYRLIENRNLLIFLNYFHKTTTEFLISSILSNFNFHPIFLKIFFSFYFFEIQKLSFKKKFLTFFGKNLFEKVLRFLKTLKVKKNFFVSKKFTIKYNLEALALFCLKSTKKTEENTILNFPSQKSQKERQFFFLVAINFFFFFFKKRSSKYLFFFRIVFKIQNLKNILIGTWRIKMRKKVALFPKKFLIGIILVQQILSFVKSIEQFFFINFQNMAPFFSKKKLKKSFNIKSYFKNYYNIVCDCWKNKVLFTRKFTRLFMQIFSIGNLLSILLNNISEKFETSKRFFIPKKNCLKSLNGDYCRWNENKFSKKLKIFKKIFENKVEELVCLIKDQISNCKVAQFSHIYIDFASQLFNKEK